MERIAGAEVRSAVKSVGLEPQGLQFGEEFQRVIMAGTPEPPVTGGSSFTALLELPPNQAMELLHSAGASESQTAHFPGNTPDDTRNPYNPAQLIMDCAPAFPSDPALIERAAKYSVFAGGGLSSGVAKESPEASPITSKSSGGVGLRVKCEPADSGSNPNSTAQVSESIAEEKVSKRKEREKKGKGSSKKNKTVRNENEDGEELPYVHVRARRGQATDSHSLAERARREKINARMKLLQELVPGCSKISGTALVLDEIINHVQSLQRQVEYLSMRLAAVNPRIDFDLDSFVAANGSLMESNFQSMVMPTLSWPEYHPTSGERAQCQQQQWQLEAPQPVWGREEDHHNLITPESSLLSYDSSANSVSLHTNQLKMEL